MEREQLAPGSDGNQIAKLQKEKTANSNGFTPAANPLCFCLACSGCAAAHALALSIHGAELSRLEGSVGCILMCFLFVHIRFVVYVFEQRLLPLIGAQTNWVEADI